MTNASEDGCAVHAAFQAVLPGKRPQRGGGEPCVIGTALDRKADVRVNYKYLEDYCVRNLERVEVDLLLIAGVIAFVDRTVTRHRATSWARRLTIKMPVHEPDRWSAPAVSTALVETLRYLTGDTWEFEFVARPDDEQALQLKLLETVPGIECILPYSGGLDSFAELRRVIHHSPQTRPFLVTAAHASGIRTQADRTVAGLLQCCHRAFVPIELAGKHREETYRTRTFLFYSIASIACRLVGGKSILIPESGQGAIGPSIVPCGNEQPYRSMHPTFTAKLRDFLHKLWGTPPPVFEHPHLWKTKAMVLRDLATDGIIDGYESTRSCGFGLRWKGISGLPNHCGICSGCVLRRVALAVGLRVSDDEERYVWERLTASDLADAVPPDHAEVTTTKNDRNVAYHGILTHQHLADAADAPNSLSIAQAAHELGRALGIPTTEAKSNVLSLIQQHRAEWDEFLGKLPTTSWFVQIAGGA